MGQWIDDKKNVYVREDHAYNLFRCTNTGVINADEFRKNLGITNNKSPRRERFIIAKQ